MAESFGAVVDCAVRILRMTITVSFTSSFFCVLQTWHLGSKMISGSAHRLAFATLAGVHGLALGLETTKNICMGSNGVVFGRLRYRRPPQELRDTKMDELED